MKKNCQLGFVNLMGLFAMTMMASFAIVIAFLHHAVESKSQFRNLCYVELPQWQSNLESATNTVLALNPMATQFRIQISITTLQWIAATTTKNYPLALHLSRQLYQLRLQQRQFGQKQKSLIRFLEIGLNAKLEMLSPKTYKKLSSNNSNWKEFVSAFDLVTVQPQYTSLPIEPDDTKSPAPIYRIKPNIESATRITATWNSSVFANKSNQTLQEQSTNWRFSCTVEQKMKKSFGIPIVNVQLETKVSADKL